MDHIEISEVQGIHSLNPHKINPLNYGKFAVDYFGQYACGACGTLVVAYGHLDEFKNLRSTQNALISHLETGCPARPSILF